MYARSVFNNVDVATIPEIGTFVFRGFTFIGTQSNVAESFTPVEFDLVCVYPAETHFFFTNELTPITDKSQLGVKTQLTYGRFSVGCTHSTVLYTKRKEVNAGTVIFVPSN